MSPPLQIVLAALPYVIALLVGFGLVMPAFEENHRQDDGLKMVQQRMTGVDKKLSDKKAAEEEHNSLESEIRKLHGAVPKTPDFDLMTRDLERMCQESGTLLISVEDPSQDALKQVTTPQDELSAALGAKEGKLFVGAKTLQKQEANKKDKDSTVSDPGLKQLSKQVYVSGDYPNLVKLFKELESYERIVGISKVDIASSARAGTGSLPTDLQKVEQLKLQKPVATFLLNLYYLP